MDGKERERNGVKKSWLLLCIIEWWCKASANLQEVGSKKKRTFKTMYL
jgi:hypothetical protein